MTEAETRKIIDEQQCKVSWEVDTDNFRYSKGTRPQKERNLAIAEWQTDSGFVDYVFNMRTEIHTAQICRDLA